MGQKKYRIRPIQKSDFSTLCHIATQVGPGFTSLPNDANVIESKITRSLDSFALINLPAARFFLFILEDLSNQTVVGTAAIEACLGYLHPYYCFELSTLIQQCETPKIRQQHRLLTLVNNYQEASLFETLYINPKHRGQGQGTFLSRTRALFIAAFPHLFPERVVAQMRGCFNEQEESLFWQGIGQHFFNMEFKTANHLVATQGSQFITDLAPARPIYVSLLPTSVQETIGKMHKQTLPAQHVLEKEGFTFRNHVDLFDGGPILETSKKHLRTVRESQTAKVAAIKNKIHSPMLYMISKADLNFKATLGPIELENSQAISIDAETANALELNQGDNICFCPFR